MTDEAAKELQELAKEIQRQTKAWPASMRSPKPGSDPSFERVLKGPDTNRSSNPTS
jgi:hypothetical protein